MSVASATSTAIAGRTYNSSSRAAEEQAASQAKADSSKRAKANKTNSRRRKSKQKRQKAYLFACAVVHVVAVLVPLVKEVSGVGLFVSALYIRRGRSEDTTSHLRLARLPDVVVI